MPSILALDQGTTGSTALVVHQDGSVLGRGYREFTQHYPRPGWVEHDPEEILRVSLEAMREALAGAPASGRPASASPTSARRWCSGTGGRWRRSAPAIVWQDRRTSDRCRELRESGARAACCASAPASWSIPTSPPPSSSGCCATPTFAAAPDGASWPRARSRAGSWPGSPAGACTSPTTPTPRARCSTTSATRAWDPELLELFGVPRELLPGHRARRRDGGGDRRRSTWASSLPIAGLAGDQQAALFGQGCCRDGLAKNTYGTGAFLLVYTGERLPVPARGTARHRRLRTTRRAGLRARGERLHRRRRGAVAARRARPHRRAPAETEALARSVPDTGGVHFVPAFVGLGHAALGAGGAGHDHGPHARHHARAPRARGARGDGLQQRRPARRRWRARAGSRCRRCGWTAARRPTTG